MRIIDYYYYFFQTVHVDVKMKTESAIKKEDLFEEDAGPAKIQIAAWEQDPLHIKEEPIEDLQDESKETIVNPLEAIVVKIEGTVKDEDEKDALQCDICEEMFNLEVDLNNHVRIHF